MDRRICTGIASFGMSGKVFHATLLSSHPRFRLKRIVERSTSEARTLYPGVLVSQSIDDLLQDDEIELVVVNTPDADHFPHAQACLEANKHVVVEKPFTQNMHDAQVLIDLARARGRILSVFQNRRWDGDFLTVQHIINTGMLGRIVEYESSFDRYRPLIQKHSWKENAESGTGLLWNLGSHMIDQVLQLFGMPMTVSARLRVIRDGGEVNDWFDVHLQYPSLQVGLKSSYLALEPRPRFLIHGERGSFVKHGVDPQEEALKNGVIPGSTGWGTEPEESWGMIHAWKDGRVSKERIPTIAGNYRAFYDNVAATMHGREEILVTPEQGREVICVIEAALGSDAAGGSAVVPPATASAR